MAHVGLIKSMQEAGIPIDIVGGTSIGSLIGAIWAEETNITRCTQRSREWSMVRIERDFSIIIDSTSSKLYKFNSGYQCMCIVYTYTSCIMLNFFL